MNVLCNEEIFLFVLCKIAKWLIILYVFKRDFECIVNIALIPIAPKRNYTFTTVYTYKYFHCKDRNIFKEKEKNLLEFYRENFLRYS